MTGTLANLSSLLPDRVPPTPPGRCLGRGHPGPGRAARYRPAEFQRRHLAPVHDRTGVGRGRDLVAARRGHGRWGGRHRVGGTLAAPTSPRQWRRREWRLDHRRDHRAWSARNLDEWHDSDSSDEERHQHTDERYDEQHNQPTSTPTTSTTSTTTTTSVTVPLPPLPVSIPPVSVGGVSVGVSTSRSGSGLTLSLP